MKKYISAGFAAVLLATAVVPTASQANTFFVNTAGGPFGQPKPIIGLPGPVGEQTSLGTWVAATIAGASNRTVSLFPAALPSRIDRNVGLGTQMIASGFAPTSPARWPFIPQ